MTDFSQFSDLEWEAFCFVADEMSDEQRIAFEARLETDQTAREAVASAVVLQSTLSAAYADAGISPARSHDSLTRNRRHSVRNRLLQISFGGALVCLAAAVGSFWLLSAPNPNPVVRNTPNSSLASKSPELALAWSAARDEVFGDESDLSEFAYDEVLESDPEANGLSFEETLSEVVDPVSDAPPSWMLAAVAGAAATDSPETEN